MNEQRALLLPEIFNDNIAYVSAFIYLLFFFIEFFQICNVLRVFAIFQ